MTISDIRVDEYAPFYEKYIGIIPNESPLLSSLVQSSNDMIGWLKMLTTSDWSYAYQPDKWTIAQLVQHVVDTEQIFLYRALRWIRSDQTPLPGFDENNFADTTSKQIEDPSILIDALEYQRLLTLHFFKHLVPDQLIKCGIGSGHRMSVRALGFIIAGHQIHHTDILKNRYSNILNA